MWAYYHLVETIFDLRHSVLVVLQGVVHVEHFVEHSVLLVQVVAHLHLHWLDPQRHFNRLLDLQSIYLVVALNPFETLEHDY